MSFLKPQQFWPKSISIKNVINLCPSCIDMDISMEIPYLKWIHIFFRESRYDMARNEDIYIGKKPGEILQYHFKFGNESKEIWLRKAQALLRCHLKRLKRWSKHQNMSMETAKTLNTMFQNLKLHWNVSIVFQRYFRYGNIFEIWTWEEFHTSKCFQNAFLAARGGVDMLIWC